MSIVSQIERDQIAITSKELIIIKVLILYLQEFDIILLSQLNIVILQLSNRFLNENIRFLLSIGFDVEEEPVVNISFDYSIFIYPLIRIIISEVTSFIDSIIEIRIGESHTQLGLLKKVSNFLFTLAILYFRCVLAFEQANF